MRVGFALQVCALLTEQCTVPPTRSTLNALAVFSYLLKHVQQTKTADRYGTLSTYIMGAQ